MTSSTNPEFGVIRSCLWPIHKQEKRRILPMLGMIYLIVFINDILRNMKDAVIVTTAGAEVIPFIKVWALLPGAIIVTLLFTFLSNRYSQERVFYLMISLFLVFFVCFATVLYPMRDRLHAYQLASFLEGILPAGCKGFIGMCRYWTFTLFYVASELWGGIVLSVLFWGFANQITRLSEAHRFYSVLCIGANCAPIFAGQMANILPENGEWETSFNLLMAFVLGGGVLIMSIFRWMNTHVLNDSSFAELHLPKKKTQTKQRLSIKESFSFLANSKYLLCIATIVISYNLVLILVEVVWKDQLRRLCPVTGDYFAYMSSLTSMIGIVSTLMAIFMARILEKLGWTGTALITPVLMLITGTGFFCFLFFQDYVEVENLAWIGASPLSIAVFFGAAQNCLSKAMKYSVLDSTKEIAFIPLDPEYKLKGKAAIDGVGSRLGKSGGSLIHTILLMVFGSLAASTPFVAGILTFVIVLWIYGTKSLGRQFSAAQENLRTATQCVAKASL